MKVVYIAFDGIEFDNESACLEHEKTMRDIVMMNRSGGIVMNTERAAVVWLKDEDSAEVFHNMAKETGDEVGAFTIHKNEYGFFFWDSYDERYVCVPKDVLNLLIALREEVRERGEQV